ncbi:hypothetical protein GUITHDRAFT_59841, partial [Guillardia theta CCMP2712]
FTMCNLLNYIDRGLVSGVLPRIGEDFDVSKTSLGLLTGSFMGGYCLLSPVFALCSTMFPPFTLIGVGLVVWQISAVMSAYSRSFRVLLLARLLSGIGEASFQAIAPPFLDDVAGENSKGVLLAVFYCAIPVGTALGYIYGGYMEKFSRCFFVFISSSEPEPFKSWRTAFLLLAALMTPFSLSSFFVSNKITEKVDNDSDMSGRTISGLFRNSVWLTAALGYAAWTFTIGAFGVWGPTFIHKVFNLPMELADLQFGAITVCMGLLGTAIGGVLLDTLTRRMGSDVATASLLLVGGLTALSIPFLVGAFLLSSRSLFYMGMIFGELLLFATTSPVNGVFLWCVPPADRSISMAVANIMIHVLGDVISPVAAG